MTEEENKKNNRAIIVGVVFIAIFLLAIFIMDYFQKKDLLKNGIRANAMVTARYYEVSDKGDTSNYSMRLTVVKDSSNISAVSGNEILSAYVKKESFDKYEEGAIVKVVYKNDDKEHAKLVVDIE